MSLRRQVILALLLWLVVVMGAVLGYRWLGGREVTLLDAVYMAVITVSTVGYHEVVDTTAHPTLRIFNIGFILVGIGVTLYVFSTLTAFIVEGELKDLFRRRKMSKQIEDMHDHLILCGAGETGTYVIQELLKTGHVFVVIDQDDARLEKIRYLGDFPVLKGDCTDDETLTAAGVQRARGLVTVLPGDKDNLMVSVTARQLNPKLQIVARCADARMADKLIRAGANSAVSPNMIGGLRIASELIRPHVVNFLDLMMRDPAKAVRVDEITLPEGSPWAGKTLGHLDLRRHFEIVPLALRKADGQTTYNPAGDVVLSGGDVLVILGDVKHTWKAREAAGENLPHRSL